MSLDSCGVKGLVEPCDSVFLVSATVFLLGLAADFDVSDGAKHGHGSVNSEGDY